MKRLSELATIHTGLTLRQRPYERSDSNLVLMQLGDLDTDGNIDFENMMSVEADFSYKRYLAEEGDIVFRGRGAGISVGIIPKHECQIAVVAPLILIRPNYNVIEPEYLVWAMNSQNAQRQYSLYIRGTSITGIGKKDLENIEIELPDIPTQRKIANLVRLQEKEKELLNQYQKARKNLIDAIIQERVSKS
ncbi:TPA: restriction endonuclease subunit S [Bacillus cereus]